MIADYPINWVNRYFEERNMVHIVSSLSYVPPSATNMHFSYFPSVQ